MWPEAVRVSSTFSSFLSSFSLDGQLTFFPSLLVLVCVTSDMFAFLGFPAPTAILSLDQYLIDF